jgi:adenylyl-sulfate kinase
MAAVSQPLIYRPGKVTRADRERLLGQRGFVVLLTGLSGSGKSTVAHLVEERLLTQGRLPYVLDGDRLRQGLSSDLGFSPAERAENLRRAAEVAALLADVGVIVLAAFIAPYRSDRQALRQRVGTERSLEVFVGAPLEVCEARDPKGLYSAARRGEIAQLTGVSAPFEPPEDPDLVLATAEEPPADSAERLLELLTQRGLLTPPPRRGSPPKP